MVAVVGIGELGSWAGLEVVVAGAATTSGGRTSLSVGEPVMFAGAEDDSMALISAPVLETVCPLGSVISDDDAEGASPSCPVLLLLLEFSGPLVVDVDVVVSSASF